MGLYYPNPFALQDPGVYIYEPGVVPEPPRVLPQRRRFPPPGAPMLPAQVSTRSAIPGAGPMPGPEPEPAIPSATPPVGGSVTPPGPPTPPTPQVEVGGPPADSERDIEAIVARLFPEPTPPVERKVDINPWHVAAIALPGLLGMPRASLEMARGAIGAQRAARESNVQAQQKFEEQQRTAQEKRATTLLPYYTEKVGEARRGQLAESRLRLDQQRARFSQDLQSAQFAFDQFKWANPSAYQQQSLQLRTIDQQIRDAHNRATDALTAGRLEEYERHNRAIEGLTAQARALTRQQVQIARQRITQADPTDAITLYRFVADKTLDLQSQLAYAIDPEERRQIEEDLGFYRQMEGDLRETVKGVAAAGGMAAAGTGAERVYTLKTSGGTATSSQVQQMIRDAIKAGKSRAEIRAALEADGVPPENFGL